MRYLPIIFLLLSTCAGRESLPLTDLSKAAIVPRPDSVEVDSSALYLDQNFTVAYPAESTDSATVGLIVDWLQDAGLEIIPEGGKKLWIVDHTAQGTGTYELRIAENEISLIGTDRSGLIHAGQTLRQLLLTRPDSVDYLPTGIIRDAPRFPHRGFMLDVSRHFFPTATVKRVIDYLAIYKLNYLHLHLSDDQGWRLEIEAYPLLTEIGGSTEVGGGEGGFYTQEEYLELQEYAGARGITIVPEFDLPGHTNAALASYAELNCDGQARDLYTGTEVGFSSVCVEKEYVYNFLDTLLGEVARITVGPYIHIGGDEVHTLSQGDYNGFIERVAEIVEQHGKIVVGWDEIAQADLPDRSIAQYWNFADNAQAAVAQGNRLIFSPATHAYLDMKYDSTTELGLAWAAYIQLEDAYRWDPAGMVPGVAEQSIVGVEAPLWSETIENLDDIEYLLFPRLAAIAEVGWTDRGFDHQAISKDETSAGRALFADFERRLLLHRSIWEAMGINYYPWKE